MYHDLFINSSFHPFISWVVFFLFFFFAIMNNAAMDILVFVLTYAFHFLGTHIPRSGIVRSRSNSVFNFWGIVQLFSATVHQATSSPGVYELPTSHIFSNTCDYLFIILLLLLLFCHPNGYELAFCCGFDL